MSPEQVSVILTTMNRLALAMERLATAMETQAENSAKALEPREPVPEPTVDVIE